MPLDTVCQQPGCTRRAYMTVAATGVRTAACRRCAGSVILSAAAPGDTVTVTALDYTTPGSNGDAPPVDAGAVTLCTRPGCRHPATMLIRALGGADVAACYRCAGAVIRDTADDCGALVDIIGLHNRENRRRRTKAAATGRR